MSGLSLANVLTLETSQNLAVPTNKLGKIGKNAHSTPFPSLMMIL